MTYSYRPDACAAVPWPRSYWVIPGRLLAGCYPGDRDPEVRAGKLAALLEHDVSCIVSLMEPDETGHDGRPFAPYDGEFSSLAAAFGVTARCLRYAVPDVTAPTAAGMREILDLVDLSLEAGRVTLVHCWGGRGRTGTVVGCWLARHGLAEGPAALAAIARLRAGDATAHQPSPQTPEQRRRVVRWSRGR